MNIWLVGWMDDSMDVYRIGQMNGRLDRWKADWLNGWSVGRMVGRLDKWIDG